MVGAFLLGAGVFSLWIVETPPPFASFVALAGGVVVGVALWFGGPSETAVLVGDAGVAVEDGRELKRVAWYAMKTIRAPRDQLIVEGDGDTLRFSIGANPTATAWTLKEAATRRPDVLDVPRALADKLPAPDAESGKRQSVSNDQVAGMRCKASGKAIRLEEDARLCPNCGQVYDKDEVPEQCLSCEAELKGRALRA